MLQLGQKNGWVLTLLSSLSSPDCRSGYKGRYVPPVHRLPSMGNLLPHQVGRQLIHIGITAAAATPKGAYALKTSPLEHKKPPKKLPIITKSLGPSPRCSQIRYFLETILNILRSSNFYTACHFSGVIFSLLLT